MLFAEKYPNAKIGQRYGASSDLLCGNVRPCLICKRQTRFVEIFSEAHFCSEECLNEFYNELSRKEMEIPEDEVC